MLLCSMCKKYESRLRDVYQRLQQVDYNKYSVCISTSFVVFSIVNV